MGIRTFDIGCCGGSGGKDRPCCSSDIIVAIVHFKKRCVFYMLEERGETNNE